MEKKKLPVGIDNFDKLRTEDFYYVDKTMLIHDLMSGWGEVNLFTRPRRFGKSLNMSMGITHIVTGDFTTHDYVAENAEDLLRNLRLNIRNGSVPVMHFSDEAKYTPDALDQYLTLNETNQNRKRYDFARLSDCLGN